MTTQLQKNKSFVLLLLNTESKQKSALLESATKSQLLTIVEIFKNLSVLQIPDSTKKVLRLRPRVYKSLQSKLLKRKTILRNAHFILRGLLSVKSQLQQILS